MPMVRKQVPKSTVRKTTAEVLAGSG